jgi:hypothetical protein
MLAKLGDAVTWPSRWRRSQLGVGRWLLDRGAVLFLADLALFVATAALARDAGAALEVALGTVSPFQTRADLVAVPLALLSWLLIPAITGAVIGVIVETELKRYRLDQDQRDERIDAIRRKLEES